MTSHNIRAVKATAAVFGVYAGILGMEHGYFETLQGNVAPKGLRIMAASPFELPFPFGHEPAMTVIPSFLLTGIAAIVVGLTIILWSAAFIETKHGAAVLLLLSVVLLLVGGGFGPMSLLIVACIGASRIDRPLTWWRTHLPANSRRVIAKTWIWWFAAALLWVPTEFAAGRILNLKNDHSQTLSNLNLMLSYPLLGFFALSLLSSFAHEIQWQIDRHQTHSMDGLASTLEVHTRCPPDCAIMSNAEPDRWPLWLSFPIAALLAVASLGGLLLPFTYGQETRIRAVQYIGNDAGNLLFIAPALIIAAILTLRGSVAARLVWMGTLVYLVCDFLGYSLAAHFNSLFLAYCGILGLSFYALMGGLLTLPIPEITRRYGSSPRVKAAGGILLLLGLAIVFHWLGEIIPALAAGRVPQAVRDSGLLTEPVAVLDLAFGAPACLIAAILMLRRAPLGIALGPIVLTFLVFSSLVLVPMGIAMTLRGFESGSVLALIGLVIATCSSVLIAISFRGGRTR